MDKKDEKSWGPKGQKSVEINGSKLGCFEEMDECYGGVFEPVTLITVSNLNIGGTRCTDSPAIRATIIYS